MSGGTMYDLKPIITRENMFKSENSCMYRMKNIHEIRPTVDHASRVNETVTDISEQVINFLKIPLPEVAVLEARQEKILAQLAELKEQVLSLCDVLRLNEPRQSSICSKKLNPVSIDLVINVNPQKYCWSIVALQNLWKDVNFIVTSYKHSSINENVPELTIFCKKNFRDTVNVSLIWKRVEDLEFIVTGVNGYPLIGETNFLRYLVREVSDYEKTSSQHEISTLNHILDLSHRLHYQESPKDVQSTLASIGKYLGTKNWLINDEAGIADVAAWSELKQSSLTKLPSNLTSWFDRCEKKFVK